MGQDVGLHEALYLSSIEAEAEEGGADSSISCAISAAKGTTLEICSHALAIASDVIRKTDAITLERWRGGPPGRRQVAGNGPISNVVAHLRDVSNRRYLLKNENTGVLDFYLIDRPSTGVFEVIDIDTVTVPVFIQDGQVTPATYPPDADSQDDLALHCGRPNRIRRFWTR